MITVTRLSGVCFLLNPDLIERADATPDTVVTLLNGTKYVVAESLEELADLVLDYRSAVAGASDRLAPRPVRAGTLHVVPNEGER